MLTSKDQTSTISPSLILNEYLGGYHRFCLEKPYHLDYVSDSLYHLLGYTAPEIHELFHDQFHQMVYEKDRTRFCSFIEQLAEKEQTLTLQYRIVHKDGHIIYLDDIITSRRSEDGQMYGFSVIADITDPLRQKRPGDFTPPHANSYGFLQCTCEKYPKITYMNSRMLEYLDVTEQPSEWLDLLKENIFFMIPFADRDTFQNDLKAANDTTDPISVEHQLLRSDGSLITLSGWLSIARNENSEPHYTLFYTQAKKHGSESQISGNSPYLRALKCAYNVIFQFNFTTKIVECIHGQKTFGINPLNDFQMPVEVGKNFWLDNYIIEEDRDMMRTFLQQISPMSRAWQDSPVKQAEFHIKWIDNVIYAYLGVAVQLDASNFLLCCRNVTRIADDPAELPSDLIEPELPIADVSVANGIFARTFGHFDLFAYGTPVIFSGEKEKELMALLIDRQGGTLSSKEALIYLWPDEAPSTTLSNRYRKIAMKLRNTLDKYGIGHILINKNGIRSIDVSAITCDCYEMLAGNKKYLKDFSSFYMTDYSWGEATLAKLCNYTKARA
jgi:PAS domain S-box-containing protein